MLSASATVMAAGFLTMRILLVCFLSELKHSSAFPTAKLGHPIAWQDGKKREVNGYGTRRPLHYIQRLRHPNRNMQQMSTSLETYPSVKPRGFALNVDVPILDLLHQRTGSTKDYFGNNGSERQPYRQNSLNFNVSDIFGKKFYTKDAHGSKYDIGLSKPSFPLSFSLTSLASSPKPSQGDGGSVADLKVPSKPELNSQTGLRLPILNFDDGKTLHQFGLISPFNLDGIQQVGQLYEPILSQLNKLPLSPSNPLRISKDKRPNGQRWGFEKLGVMKPPSLDILSTLVSLSKKNHDKAQPDPSKGVPSLFYNAKVKTNHNSYVQGFKKDSSGSPLVFHNKPYDNGQFKPSTNYTQNIEREHYSNPLRPYDLPILWEVGAPNYEAKNELKWQKRVSLPYDYSSRREASHDVDVSDSQPNPLALSTEYQTQSKFPGQDTDVNRLKIPTDLLQNLKPWFQSNNAPSPNKKPQSYLQILCIDGADCSHMPEKRRQTYHSPKRDEYSPYAEAIAVSLPSNQQYPFKSILSHRPYHVEHDLQ